MEKQEYDKNKLLVPKSIDLDVYVLVGTRL